MSDLTALAWLCVTRERREVVLYKDQTFGTVTPLYAAADQAPEPVGFVGTFRESTAKWTRVEVYLTTDVPHGDPLYARPPNLAAELAEVRAENELLRKVHDADQAVMKMADESWKCDLAELAEANKWRQAVIDALVVSCIYTSEHDTDPRKAIQDLVAWESQIALDPAVSSDARALIDEFRERAEKAEAVLAGWSFEPSTKHGIQYMTIKAPNGYSAHIASHAMNPANILYMLAEAIRGAKE